MATDYDIAVVMGQAICQRIGEPRYNLWFAGKTKLTCEEDRLTIGVPNLFLQDWLQKKFGSEVRAVVDEVLGSEAVLQFAIDPQLFQQSRQSEAAIPRDDCPAEPVRRPHVRRRRLRSLQDFVVGPCNRVAHASAVSLVETPEECPSPLVLHGPVGVGKTRLLEGICEGFAKKQADLRIQFLSAEEFTNRFLQAMQQKKLAAFRQQFRSCDALVVDDIGFLAKKQATQEEFLHTLDALQAEHRPIVLSSDCHPRLADHWLPELTDRLVGGAVWGIATPDHATRLQLLRAKAIPSGGVSESILAFLAENLRGNVRELEGAIHTVQHLGKVHGRCVDLDLAREALGDLLRHSLRAVQLDDVERAVCSVLGISRDWLLSKKRTWPHSYPRMLAMYLARAHTRATYGEVGKHFGGRNHSTVVAAEKKARQWLADNITLQLGKRVMPVRDIVEQIERALADG